MTRRRIDGADVTDDELALARRYPMLVSWAPDDGVFVATFPDVPGLKAYGSTAGAAAHAGEEVVILWVTSMLDFRRKRAPIGNAPGVEPARCEAG